MSFNFLCDVPFTVETAQALAQQGRFHARALLLADQFDLRPFSLKKRTSQFSSVLIGIDHQRVGFLFGYGVLVYFSPESAAEPLARWIEAAAPYTLGQTYQDIKEESYQILVQEGVEGIQQGICTINRITKEHLELIAEVLARSLILDKHEALIADRFEKVKPIAYSIIGDTIQDERRDLLQFIGANLIAEHELAGRAEIIERPYLLWDHSYLENFYFQLMEEFEITERHANVERKMEVISRTARTYLDVAMHRHDLRLEWYIIILIFIEIVLEVYTLFVH